MKENLTNNILLKEKSILYIEDEDNIRDTLTSTLRLMCKKVFPFSCARNALENFTVIQPDIILSDISLGEMSGIQFIQEIRKFDSKIPIIILSAHTSINYLLEANKLKLVEYLIKPITFQELENTLSLAIDEIQANLLDFYYINSNVKFDISHKILYVDNNIKKLSINETNLLELFIKNKNRTVSTEEIKNYIWNDSYHATDTALKSLLHKIRQKIGKDSIKNVSGIGYYLNNSR
jgi:DNA-binding response OmpR family regulator